MEPKIVTPETWITDVPKATLYYGQNVIETLRGLPAASIQTVCTSPPYWGLRDYGSEGIVWGGSHGCEHEWVTATQKFEQGNKRAPVDTDGRLNQRDPENQKGKPAQKEVTTGFCTRCNAWKGQLGQEPTPALYCEHMVEVFTEVARVLRPDGTLWINLGDSYASGGRSTRAPDAKDSKGGRQDDAFRPPQPDGLKPKDLVGIPWRVAFALQEAGWYLRSDIIWSKPNPMPESVTDRPTKAHEYVFLFAHPDSGGRYFYDHFAIREASSNPEATEKRYQGTFGGIKNQSLLDTGQVHTRPIGTRIFQEGRNKRTVWNVNTKPYAGAHFAVWPEALVEPMILAGTSEKGQCPQCGSPWVRTLNREWTDSTRKHYKRAGAGDSHWDGLQPTGRVGGFEGGSLQHSGFSPSCTCPEHEPVRQTVLDPFSGSGTTGAVAMRLNRDYLGCDLNGEYLELAVARLEGKKPSRAKEPEQGIEDDNPILDLFGVGDE